MCNQAYDRLTEHVSFGLIIHSGHVGSPKLLWNNVALSDIHHLSASRSPVKWLSQSLPGKHSLSQTTFGLNVFGLSSLLHRALC